MNAPLKSRLRGPLGIAIAALSLLVIVAAGLWYAPRGGDRDRTQLIAQADPSS